jgi:hypothetical protein
VFKGTIEKKTLCLQQNLNFFTRAYADIQIWQKKGTPLRILMAEVRMM